MIYSNLMGLRESEKFSDILELNKGLYERPLQGDFETIPAAFRPMNECTGRVEHLVVALDDFHSLVENISSLRLRGGERARDRLIWLLRDRIQRMRSDVFLIVLMSAGFLFGEYGRADRAFLMLFQKVEVKPLDEESSAELAEALLKGMGVRYSEEAVRTIAKLSGGVPSPSRRSSGT